MLVAFKLLVVGAVVSALATPFVRRAARALGLVDVPSARRVHLHPVPRGGGLAIALGFFLSWFFFWRTSPTLAASFAGRERLVLGFVGGSLLMLCLGLVDDARGVSPAAKLAVQLAAATFAYAAGFCVDQISLPFFGPLKLGAMSFPATALWIVGVINAMNLVDGLDGLAAGVAVHVCLTTCVVATIGENSAAVSIAACLGGSILGFLVHNFNPATIFMGDTGSLFLGYALSTLSLFGSRLKGTTAISILVPVLALGLPLMDTLLAIVRRALEKEQLFLADRAHLHHRLLATGVTHRRAVIVLYGLSLLFTATAILVEAGRSWQVAVALVVLVAVVGAFVRFVRYFHPSPRSYPVEGGERTGRETALLARLPVTLAEVHRARRPDEIAIALQQLAEACAFGRIEIIGDQSVAVAPDVTIHRHLVRREPRRDLVAEHARTTREEEQRVDLLLTVLAGAVARSLVSASEIASLEAR